MGTTHKTSTDVLSNCIRPAAQRTPVATSPTRVAVVCSKVCGNCSKAVCPCLLDTCQPIFGSCIKPANMVEA